MDSINSKTVIQFIKSFFSGASAAIVEYGTFYAMNTFLGLWYPIAHPVSMAIGFILSYMLNRIWAFNSKSGVLRQLIMMLVLLVVNMGISDLLFYILKDILGLATLLAKLIIMGSVFCWNFVIYKKLIFK